MLYDSTRTRDVVNRLVLLGNNLRGVLILMNATLFGVLFGILGALVSGQFFLIFALVGIIAGVAIGYFLAGALATVLEWMAQMLISQQPRQ